MRFQKKYEISINDPELIVIGLFVLFLITFNLLKIESICFYTIIMLPNGWGCEPWGSSWRSVVIRR